MNRVEADELFEKNPKAAMIAAAIGLMVSRIYKNEEESKPFFDRLVMMMEDKEYLPVKMLEMPGYNPEAEETLREMMGIFLERRI